MKTLGTKLDNDICQKFIDCCNNNGQTVSERIRELILDELEFVNNCKDCDEESITDFRKIRKNIGKHDEGGWTIDDDGTPLNAQFVWFTDEEKKEIDDGERLTMKSPAKPTLTLID